MSLIKIQIVFVLTIEMYELTSQLVQMQKSLLSLTMQNKLNITVFEKNRIIIFFGHDSLLISLGIFPMHPWEQDHLFLFDI